MRPRRSAFGWLTLMALGALAGYTASPEQRFADWRQTRDLEPLARYRERLSQQGVGDVAPMHALLRSSRRWQSCGAAEFALPPREHWDGIVPTLRLLRQLQADGLVDGRLIRSGYRDAALNRCSGGSSRSQHLRNNAIDLDLDPATTDAVRLCAYWRHHGPALHMGLGFYSAIRIHIDTAGYRSWGQDHTHRTSLCNRAAPP